MKKTIFVTLLAAMMLFAFTACENSTSTDISKVTAYSGSQFTDYLANDAVKEITVAGEISINVAASSMVIDHAVAIKGAQDSKISVDSDPAGTVFVVAADDVTFDGVKIEATANPHAVIQSTGNNFRFVNSTITGAGNDMGIVLDTNVTTGTVIENSTIAKTDRAVYASAMVTDYRINALTFDGYIELENVSENAVIENSQKTAEDSTTGIFIFTNTGAETEAINAALERFKAANSAIADAVTSAAIDPANSL